MKRQLKLSQIYDNLEFMTQNEAPESNNESTRFSQLAINILKSGSFEGRRAILEFMSVQSCFSEAEALPLVALIDNNVLSPDPQVRYFARKARNHFAQTYHGVKYPTGNGGTNGVTNGDTEPPDTMPQKDILLRKLRLGSKYVAFEAIERLTESKDESLAEPLMAFLREESDPFKISYLAARLSRIQDPRIPFAIADQLNHPDPRVTANALEGLYECDIPQLKDKIAQLAQSTDNRIRANAVKVLYKYDPTTAENHLREMLESPLIALQDSGVYLLGILNPPNSNALLEIALNSKFTTVRLRALEIPWRVRASKIQTQEVSQIDTSRFNSRGLTISLLLGTGLAFFGGRLPMIDISIMILATGVALSVIFKRFSDLVLKIVSTAGLLAGIYWLDGGILVIPTLLAIWIGPPKRNRKPDLDWSPSTTSWIYIIGALFLCGILQSDTLRIIRSITSVDQASAGHEEFLRFLMNQNKRFQGIIFGVTSGCLFCLLHLNRWFPKDKFKRPKIYYWGLGIGFLLIIVLNLSFHWGIKLTLFTNGIKETAQIFTLFAK